MNTSTLKRFENQFNISIFNYQDFSGSAYKCSLSFIHSPEAGVNKQFNIVVKGSQTISSVIESALNK